MVDHIAAVPETGKIVAQKSFAASRQERMVMYQERYKYQPPESYTNHTVRDDLCGLSPDYANFFSQGHPLRSANNEDKLILRRRSTRPPILLTCNAHVGNVGSYSFFQTRSCVFLKNMMCQKQPIRHPSYRAFGGAPKKPSVIGHRT